MKASRRGNKKSIIGLTGSFGTGKSTVAGIFRSFGAQVIDADRIAHGVIKPGEAAYKKIVAFFGKEILKKNSEIERKKLAGKVFNDRNKLKRLNKIVHPEVIRIIKNKIKSSNKKIIVLDAPLLIEANLKGLVDKLIVVKASPKKQIQRIARKIFLSKSDILKRINAQIPLSDKVRSADFVIDNNGTIEKTRKQIEVILGKMNILPRSNSRSDLCSLR